MARCTIVFPLMPAVLMPHRLQLDVPIGAKANHHGRVLQTPQNRRRQTNNCNPVSIAHL
jgi:hypothetical protein